MFRVTKIAIWIERGSVVAWEAADLMMRCRDVTLAVINEISGAVTSQTTPLEGIINAPAWRGTRLPDWHHKFCKGKHGPC